MTSDDDLLLCARLFEGVPWDRTLSTLTLVLHVCLAEGILTQSEVQPVMMQWVSQDPSSAPLAGIPLAGLSPAPVRSRSDEIDALYAELHRLAEAASDAPSQEANYQACLSRLRELQALEAREMLAFAESRRQLPRGALDGAMAQVRALLEAHEGSST